MFIKTSEGLTLMFDLEFDEFYYLLSSIILILLCCGKEDLMCRM